MECGLPGEFSSSVHSFTANGTIPHKLCCCLFLTCFVKSSCSPDTHPALRNLLENESGFILKNAVFEVEGLKEDVIETDDWKPYFYSPHPITGKEITNFPDDFRFIQKCVFTSKEGN